MAKKSILYAGDSPIPGAANYLYGLIKSMKLPFTHVPPHRRLYPGILRKKYSAVILSDFSRKQLPGDSEKMIVQQTMAGSGLLMIGGWASFSGPFGGWRGSAVEKLLPVKCSAKDDRLNFPGGAHVRPASRHPILNRLSFIDPPAICGMNRIGVKPSGRVILGAHKLGQAKGRVVRQKKAYPLLVIDRDPGKRVAALTCDLAPHWCGGWVDWGGGHRKYHVDGGCFIEVGQAYARFVTGLLRWLIRS